MANKTYAVIGSNCFTGSHIVDRFLEVPGATVLAISRSPEKSALYLPYKARPAQNVKFFQVDLFRHPDQLMRILDEHEVPYVINVAALSEVGLSNYQPVEYFQVNCLGVVNLCNQLRERKYLKRYLHISSAEVYGSCPEPLTEDAPLHPSTPYAASKAAGDMYLTTLVRNFGFPADLIRSTNVYGKHQQLFKIIPRTFIYLKQGKKIQLHGGGKAVKTWIHIKDVVDGIVKVLEKGPAGEIYNFTDDHSTAIADLVKTLCRLAGRDFEASTELVGERLGQDARYVLNDQKARTKLGWKPQVPFEAALREVYQWVEDEWDAIRGESLVYVHQV